MKFVVAGGSGLIGSAFIKDALNNKHEIVKLVRRKPKELYESQWNPDTGEIDLNAINNSKAIINLSGARCWR